MNKKLNTALFLVVATIGNILALLVIWLVPTSLYARFLAIYVSQTLSGVIYILIFAGALLATYSIYNWIMGKIIAKGSLEKYIEPIFHKKNTRGK